MPKHLRITSNDTVLFDKEINNCNECPCWNDGSDEYTTTCVLRTMMNLDTFGFTRDDHGYGVDERCPLKDKESPPNNDEPRHFWVHKGRLWMWDR